MRKIIAASRLLLIFTANGFSQDTSTRIKDLTEKINTLYQKGKFAETIK